MSTATRRSLQIEERLRAPIQPNGNQKARTNGNEQPRLRHTHLNDNGHGNGVSGGNGSNGNGALRTPAKPRVFVAAENRFLREALSRMLTKNGDIEVITSEAGERFPRPVQYTSQDPFQNGNQRPSCEPRTHVLPESEDAEILSSKGNLDQDWPKFAGFDPPILKRSFS
ncbi:MAG TPA: hypothetical protein VJN89_08410 [Candidatus Acidoferrum sp.]|nr:hypothetical protein [Candidatus Acidoferrum sp.]